MSVEVFFYALVYSGKANFVYSNKKLKVAGFIGSSGFKLINSEHV